VSLNVLHHAPLLPGGERDRVSRWPDSSRYFALTRSEQFRGATYARLGSDGVAVHTVRGASDELRQSVYINREGDSLGSGEPADASGLTVVMAKRVPCRM